MKETLKNRKEGFRSKISQVEKRRRVKRSEVKKQ
jgi:hypothetical protein